MNAIAHSSLSLTVSSGTVPNPTGLLVHYFDPLLLIFRFTKLNIIDKFGQALVAIDPQPRLTGPPPLYPGISDFYEPQMVDSKTANTVIQDDDYQCEFIQLP